MILDGEVNDFYERLDEVMLLQLNGEKVSRPRVNSLRYLGESLASKVDNEAAKAIRSLIADLGV